MKYFSQLIKPNKCHNFKGKDKDKDKEKNKNILLGVGLF